MAKLIYLSMLQTVSATTLQKTIEYHPEILYGYQQPIKYPAIEVGVQLLVMELDMEKPNTADSY